MAHIDRIEITDPKGIHAEGEKHEVRFWRGSNLSVVYLTDEELAELSIVAAERLTDA